jgi:soluble lytic murein transglycosylase-like protein
VILRRRTWILASAGMLAGAVALVGVYYLGPQIFRGPEIESAPKPSGPADLTKLRTDYSEGVDALKRGDALQAVKRLSSFNFGERAVEEYRLYYLGKAHQLSGDRAAARAMFDRLFRRDARLIHADDAGLSLGSLYAQEGDTRNSTAVYRTLAARAATPAAGGRARWEAFRQSFRRGDVATALESAKQTLIKNPKAPEAASALAAARALYGVGEKGTIPLTPSERLERAVNLLRDRDPRSALEELNQLQRAAPPSMNLAIQLNRGLALHHLRRFEESNTVLEPLASGYYKYAIPAIYHAAKNYRVLSDSIDPMVTKTITEKKKVGTIKVRVKAKGKKKSRLVTRPKYANVKRNVKLVDLAKKTKKENYDRLASERLKDLLALPLSDPVRLEVLQALIARAQAKNQDDYMQELIGEVVKIDRALDPGLQYFWDKAWAAYARGDLAAARPLLRFIRDTYSSPNVKRQSAYWLARSMERMGEREEAEGIYRQLAAAPYDDLYARYAKERGAPRVRPKSNPLKEDRQDWPVIAEQIMPPELRLAYELTALSQMRDARLELQKNANPKNRHLADALLADILNATGNQILIERTLRRAFPQIGTVEQDAVPQYFLKMYYPMKYEDLIKEHAEKNGLDPHLVMGLIHQESYYNPRARSPVGATGLMQIMPATGKELAGILRIPFAESRLENPEVNIRLGTLHLRRMINLFNGNTRLATAAYNAGQGNVAKWRRASRGKPLDEFLESIPFSETRTYVKRIAIFESTYQRFTQ